MNRRDIGKIQNALNKGWRPKDILATLPADTPTTDPQALVESDGRLAIEFKYYEKGDADNPVSTHRTLYDKKEVEKLLKEL